MHRLDATGLLCPLPVLRTARLVEGLAAGEVVEVVGDDPTLPADLEAWCATTGHRLVAVESLAGGAFRCRLEIVKKT